MSKLWQFRLRDWLLFAVLMAELLGIARLLMLMSKSRREGGYVVSSLPRGLIALLAVGLLTGGVLGGTLAVLGGWSDRFWLGFLIGAMIAMLAPLAVLASLYAQ